MMKIFFNESCIFKDLKTFHTVGVTFDRINLAEISLLSVLGFVQSK